jgi:hypothetical protein
MDIPCELRGYIRDYNGNFIAHTRNPNVLAPLIKYCYLLDNIGYRWRLLDPNNPFKETKNQYLGLPCYIIGKGPSLDYLTEYDLDPSYPKICINQAIHYVEDYYDDHIYAAQLDVLKINESCWSTKGSMLLGIYSGRLYNSHPKKYIITPDLINHETRVDFTVGFAAKISQFWGCSKQIFVSCDASAIGEWGYPKQLQHLPDNMKYNKRFFTQRAIIERICNNHEFYTPKMWSKM